MLSSRCRGTRDPGQLETLVGPYRILSRLGRGGMGEVWLAEDTRLDRRVALKTVRPLDDGDAASRTRLMREARKDDVANHQGYKYEVWLIRADGSKAMIDDPELEIVDPPL